MQKDVENFSGYVYYAYYLYQKLTVYLLATSDYTVTYCYTNTTINNYIFENNSTNLTFKTNYILCDSKTKFYRPKLYFPCTIIYTIRKTYLPKKLD